MPNPTAHQGRRDVSVAVQCGLAIVGLGTLLVGLLAGMWWLAVVGGLLAILASALLIVFVRARTRARDV